MRILIVHNRYRERGGEDSVVDAESSMLEQHGHCVERLFFDNGDISGTIAKVLAAGRIFYSVRSAKRVKDALDAFHPDIVHVHNFVATLSPSVFYATKSRKVSVVMTLHNYRLECPSGVMFREGAACEECPKAGNFLPAVQHGCYRGSRFGSAALGGSIALHSLLGVWQNRVDRYIVLTHFAVEKMRDGHRVPTEKIRIKPNFVPDAAPGNGGGGYALYVGRLSPEKGISTILEADEKGLLTMPLWIAGEGPMADCVRRAAQRDGSQLRLRGAVSRAQVQELMRRAEVLVLPSIWYEGFPMVCAEAYSLGLPILCSRIGGLPEIVLEGITGDHFSPGDATGLAVALRRFHAGTLGRDQLRQAARQLYLDKYSEKRNYEMLMSIYNEIV
jgi:glycosyltransferase involved in cell wall biosynthesis